MTKKLAFLVFFLILFVCSTIKLSAQWVSMEGPYGGTVYDMAKNENYVYTATGSGAFRSSNAGESWEKLESGIGNHYLCYIIAANKHAVLGEFINKTEAEKTSIFYSENDGSQWQEIPYPDSIAGIYDLALLDHGIYLATTSQLYRTTDLGVTWENVLPWPGLIRSIEIYDNKFFISSSYYSTNRIIYSDTLGQNWSEIEAPFKGEIIFVKDENILFGGSYNDSLNFSLDLGQTWNVSTHENWWNSSAHSVFIDSALYVSQFGYIYKTTDWGHHFTLVDNQVYDQLGIRRLVNVGDTIVRGSLRGGVLRSFNFGDDWEEADSGMYASAATNIFPYGNALYAASNYEGLSKYVDGEYWDFSISYPAEKPIYDLIIVDDVILTSTDFNVLIRSTNFGASWEFLHQPGPMFEPHTIEKFLYHEPYVYGVSSSANAIARSTNYGAGWENIASVIQDQTPFYFYPQDFVVHNEILIAASFDVLAKSEDNGTTWSTQSIDIDINSAIVELFSIDSVLFMEIWDVNPSGLLFWRSFDNGETWEDITQNVPNLYAQTGVFDLKKVGDWTLLSLGSAGIFVSPDYGKNWAPFNEGLGTLRLPEFAVLGDYIYASSTDYGVWKRNIVDLENVIINTKNLEKLTNSNLAVYPNPSDGIISFLAKTSKIEDAELQVFHSSGKIVKTITTKAGILSQLNMSSLPKGLYFLQLKTNSELFTGKVILE